jgi:hypothetical protein
VRVKPGSDECRMSRKDYEGEDTCCKCCFGGVVLSDDYLLALIAFKNQAQRALVSVVDNLKKLRWCAEAVCCK